MFWKKKKRESQWDALARLKYELDESIDSALIARAPLRSIIEILDSRLEGLRRRHVTTAPLDSICP